MLQDTYDLLWPVAIIRLNIQDTYDLLWPVATIRLNIQDTYDLLWPVATIRLIILQSKMSIFSRSFRQAINTKYQPCGVFHDGKQ